MTGAELERLIESITEEIYLRLGGDQASATGPAGGAEIEELVHCGACRVSFLPSARPLKWDPQVAALIDHTLLKPEATREEITRICQEALEYGFASVCVNPYWVPLVADRLRCSAVKACTVCGFPFGASYPAVKRAEAAEAVKLGAQEVDMVINVGALRSGDLDVVRHDIGGVVEVCHAAGALTKVILETALLSDEDKVAGCLLARAAGADFVKTSTGFGPGGATTHDVELMRFVVGEELGVKASGGVRSLDDVKKMVSAGASRIGASASVKIMEEAAGIKAGPPTPAPSAY